ncbi:LacI family DNA-binding transcriptional regulator [Agromyces silvae]|uniref:LacI family DNA-binding transcriptional regulator n=1 Tax=Agromyces silvae TaxID=3388266 RepID=UPI00280B3C35|nr:LacI family DNA-binding transcriptional regulator [Agromyces protaetiae]
MATIYDVAKLAGVSPATVSRVYSGVVPVSAGKAEAVRRAAAELRFTPSGTARALRTQSSEVIALVIPDIENPYFTEMARGVEDVANDAGYSVVLCNTDGDRAKEAAYLDVAVSARMAGVIIAAADAGTDLGALHEHGRPVVAVDRTLEAAMDAVVMDNREAGAAATEALLDAGYGRIACVTGPETVETARQRAEGWRAALERRGLAAPSARLRYSTFRVEGGRSAVDELLAASDPPDAIVAGNNLLGVGVLQRLAEHGLTPPALGVAVIGSLPYATLPVDAVTVVRLPARDMGETGAQMLLDRLHGDGRPPRTLTLHGVVRPAQPR